MKTKDDYLRAAYVMAVAEGYPPTLRDKLLSTPSLIDRAAIETDAVITLGADGVSFQRSALMPAVSAAFDRVSQTVITAVNGDEWTVKFAAEATPPNVVLERGEQRLFVAQFTLLDPDPDARLQALDAAAKHNLMSGEIVDRWRALLTERAPDDRELMDFRQDLQNTPVGEAEAVAESLRDGGLSLDVLIPRESTYYQQLVGEAASTSGLETYLSDGLAPFLERLLAGGDIRALSLAWLTCSQPLVSPLIERAWKGEPETLAKALRWLSQFGDPISIVGGIEVGLRSLQTEPAIEPSLRDLIASILAETPEDQPDPFELLSALFVCVYGHMALRRILVDWRPFARRAAAIAHAAVLVRQLRNISGNAEDLIRWLRGPVEPYFTLQCVVDMRLEPRWFPELARPEQWRNELLGRVLGAAANSADAVESLGLTDRLLGKDADALQHHVGGLESMLPGPLEGASPPRLELSADAFAHIETSLQAQQIDTVSFTPMINASMWWHLPDTVISAAVAALERCEYQVAARPEVDLDTCLLGLASVAAVYRSKELHDALRIVVRLAWRLNPGALSPDATFRIGVLSCAAFHDKVEWSKQLGFVMTELSYLDFTVGQAVSLQSNLSVLCHLEPELWGTCGQAEAALALAAGR